MFKGFIITIAGALCGILASYFLITKTDILSLDISNTISSGIVKPAKTPPVPKKIVIGFLPFWLIDKAQSDYSSYITDLSYFNVVIDEDGTIQKFTAPGESDPGWHSLSTGKVGSYLKKARDKNIKLSLTIFSGNDKKIDKFLENPIESANNLTRDINPILIEHGFTDLNLDIEKVGDASGEQREKFLEFVSQVRKNLNKNITLTLDVVSSSFVKDTNLCDPVALAKVVDYIVVMGYDFHNPSSYVTGPVAPQNGAGDINEFDIKSAIQAASALIPKEKIVLAIPLYGYSWETINDFPRAAVMPGSAYSISSRSVKELIDSCHGCVPKFDETDAESYIISKNEDTGLYEQVFYPDQKSTKIKVDFALSQNLGGLALWALGYEDSSILSPLSEYLR